MWKQEDLIEVDGPDCSKIDTWKGCMKEKSPKEFTEWRWVGSQEGKELKDGLQELRSLLSRGLDFQETEKVYERKLAIRIYIMEVGGTKGRKKTKIRWTEGLKKLVKKRSLEISRD